MKKRTLSFALAAALGLTAPPWATASDLEADRLDARRVEVERIQSSDTAPEAVSVDADTVFSETLDIAAGSVLVEGIPWIVPQGDVPMGCFTNLPNGSIVTQGNPGWWTEYGVVETNVPNDFAAATQGQVKWIAHCAAAMLDAQLPTVGGAGTTLSNLVSSFTQTNNAIPVTIGQLKNTAAPFWMRLAEFGVSTNFPWTGEGVNDFALANIGQVKSMFSFDLDADSDADGMSDGWEVAYGFKPLDANDGTADADGDGLTNLQEFLRHTNPTDPASINCTLYADSDVGGSQYDGLSKTILSATHGPKVSVQQAINAAISGDVIELSGQSAFTDTTLSPGTKSLVLRPVGSLRF